MTNMDKKINELNEKLGRKTGIDFKESAKVMAKEVYENKPLFIGLSAGASIFVFTGTGLILSALVGTGIGYGVKTFKSKIFKD